MRELGFKLKDLHPNKFLYNVDSLKLVHVTNIVEEYLDRELTMEKAFELDIKCAEKNSLKLMEKDTKEANDKKINKV